MFIYLTAYQIPNNLGLHLQRRHHGIKMVLNKDVYTLLYAVVTCTRQPIQQYSTYTHPFLHRISYSFLIVSGISNLHILFCLGLLRYAWFHCYALKQDTYFISNLDIIISYLHGVPFISVLG